MSYKRDNKLNGHLSRKSKYKPFLFIDTLLRQFKSATSSNINYVETISRRHFSNLVNMHQVLILHVYVFDKKYCSFYLVATLMVLNFAL